MHGSRRAMQRGRRAAGALVLLAALSGAAALPAAAAVRLCEPRISSGPVLSPNEDTARAAALAIWTSKARALGEPYASWRIAADKMLVCKRRSDGTFECLATAAPCTIEQAPDRRHLRQKRMGI